MILAAGLGTRLRPLTNLRAKAAVPVRGLALIRYSLELLARSGVTEVIVNVHHLAEPLMEAAERHCPPGLDLQFSREWELLDTGGGIRRVVGFLRESDPCLLVAGDMVLDVDLDELVARHRERRDLVTLLLREDTRGERFGTLGVDAEGRVRRIPRGPDLGDATRRGLWCWANVAAARLFDDMPDDEVSVFLDWLSTAVANGANDVRAELLPCHWEPVGTLPEYLRANLEAPALSFMAVDQIAEAEGTRFAPGVVLGAGTNVGKDTQLERVVVWDGETIPPGLKLSNGVYAGGVFHSCAGKDGR